MTIMVIIPYTLYTLLSGLSGFPCKVLVLCKYFYLRMFSNTNVLSTQAMSNRNVLEKCDVGHLLEKAMQFSVP